MSGLLLTLVNHSLSACWLILAILLLRPLLRKVSPSISCALWSLLAIRLLCPFRIESGLSLIPNADPIPAESAAWALRASTGRIIVTVWLAGVVALAMYLIISSLRLYLQTREAVQQEEGFWLCDGIASPFVLGFLRPRILLPYAVEKEDIPYILAHEKAHLARHDHWRKPIGFALLALFWFQPLLWLAYFLLCRDIEFACDEHAVRTLGKDVRNRKSYAEALIHSVSPRASIIACPLAFGGMQIKRRVSFVLYYRKPAMFLTVVSLIVCAAVAVCFLSDPFPHAPEPVEVSFFSDNGTQLYEQEIMHRDHLYREDLLAQLKAEAYNAEALSGGEQSELPFFLFESEEEWLEFQQAHLALFCGEDYEERLAFYEAHFPDNRWWEDLFKNPGYVYDEAFFEENVLILTYVSNRMILRQWAPLYECDGKLVQVLQNPGYETKQGHSTFFYLKVARSELAKYPEGFSVVSDAYGI